MTSHDFALLGRRVRDFFVKKRGGGCGIFGSVGWKHDACAIGNWWEPTVLIQSFSVFDHVFVANLWNRPLYPNSLSPFEFGWVFCSCNSLKMLNL